MNSENYVTKSNKLIEAKGKMTTLEQKIFATLISEIDIDDKDFKEYEFNIKKFIDLSGSNENKIYIDIHDAARRLMNKIITIETDKTIMTIALLVSVETPKGKGIVKMRFHPFLKPYLLDLQGTFTKYQLKYVLQLKGTHSIRIYELLKQYEKIGKREIQLEKLKSFLGLKNEYDRIYDFERYVLKPAQKEINDVTDITVDYKKIKEGRRIAKISFIISSKKYKDPYLKSEDGYKYISQLRNKMPFLELEKLNDEQINELYTIAVEKTENINADVYQYMKMNYYYSKMRAEDSFLGYYIKALENNYAKVESK